MSFTPHTWGRKELGREIIPQRVVYLTHVGTEGLTCTAPQASARLPHTRGDGRGDKERERLLAQGFPHTHVGTEGARETLMRYGTRFPHTRGDGRPRGNPRGFFYLPPPVPIDPQVITAARCREGGMMANTRTVYIVAVYLIDRAYGGPEEGGWTNRPSSCANQGFGALVV